VSLQITTEEDERRQLKVTVDVPEERVQQQMRRTARHLSRHVNIPGFRRGKVPYNVLVRRVGEQNLRADAVEEMLEEVLAEAMQEVDAEAYRQPTLDSMEMEPLQLKLTIPLEPQVELGDYRSIRKEVPPVEVKEEAVDEALEHIRTHHQKLETVERPAQPGDMLKLDGEGRLTEEDEELIWRAEDGELLLDEEQTFPGLPFVENLIGLSAGDEKSFEITFPEDYEEEELSGKTAIFQVTVNEVQERELPELDDELAQEEGDFETLEELREKMREQLQEQAEQTAHEELIDAMVEEMLESAELVYPPAVVESELDDIVASFKEQITRSGFQWDDYLTLERKTEASLRDEWRERAVERVERGLVISQFVREEQLNVSSDELDSAVDQRLDQFADSENQALRDQLRGIFMQGEGLQMMSNEILMDKVYHRVEAIVTGNAPDLEALAAEAAATASEDEEE